MLHVENLEVVGSIRIIPPTPKHSYPDLKIRVSLVTVDGPFDENAAIELGRVVESLNSQPKLLLNLENCPYVRFDEATEIYHLSQKLKKAGGIIALCGIKRESFMEPLQRAGVTLILDVYPDVKTGLFNLL